MTRQVMEWHLGDFIITSPNLIFLGDHHPAMIRISHRKPIRQASATGREDLRCARTNKGQV